MNTDEEEDKEYELDGIEVAAVQKSPPVHKI